MLLMIDNYDSFTYNLVQYFSELGQQAEVYRNDQITVKEIEAKNPQYLVLSPGPCTPNEAGICLEAIKYFSGKIPLLGVCLGHQSIGQAFGGNVIRAPELMHGKTSEIFHNSQNIFRNIPNPFVATRYHSLIVEKESLPQDLEITAWTKSGEIMGLQHKTLPVYGVQFHPESIMTIEGKNLLNNFLNLSK